MEDIEQMITKGNVKVYYQGGALSAEIKGLKIGKEHIDVEFKRYNDSTEVMCVSYQDIKWNIHNFKGEITGITPIGRSLKSNEAVKWASANNELIKNSPKRLNKAVAIWDKVYGEITQVPLVLEYLDGYNDYLIKRAKENNRHFKEYDANRKKEKAELEKRFKNQPDPLDSLVNIILA